LSWLWGLLAGDCGRSVSLCLLLLLAWGIPVGAVVAVLVEGTPCEVPPLNQLRECSLDGFGADLYALLSLQLLSHLLCCEACVGHAVAYLATFASADDTQPSFDDTQAERSDGRNPLPIGGRHFAVRGEGGVVCDPLVP